MYFTLLISMGGGGWRIFRYVHSCGPQGRAGHDHRLAVHLPALVLIFPTRCSHSRAGMA